jgi:hypothetical protein
MSKPKTAPPIDNPKPAQPIPHHPFFEFANDQASFIECIDAINRVESMIELCNFLNLDGDSEGGLTPKAASGYYWLSVLTRETLSYVGDRLVELNRQQREKHQGKAAYLSALLRSLPSLGGVNRDRFLNNAAAQMNITRSELDQFVRKTTEK